jgi:predicted GIY-YIG superfamily endonuclease
MPFHVYILECADKSLYTGHTDNLEARLGAHHRGTLRGYTSRRRPLRLVFTEEFATREEALAAERQIKGWCRAKKQALTRNDWEEIKRLSRR